MSYWEQYCKKHKELFDEKLSSSYYFLIFFEVDEKEMGA